jgi:hypothetical protein
MTVAAAVADEDDRAARVDVEVAGRVGVFTAPGTAELEVIREALESDDVDAAAGRTSAKGRIRIRRLHGFAQRAFRGVLAELVIRGGDFDGRGTCSRAREQHGQSKAEASKVHDRTPHSAVPETIHAKRRGQGPSQSKVAGAGGGVSGTALNRESELAGPVSGFGCGLAPVRARKAGRVRAHWEIRSGSGGAEAGGSFLAFESAENRKGKVDALYPGSAGSAGLETVSEYVIRCRWAGHVGDVHDR